VSITGGASTLTDDSTQTSTATSYVTLPPVTVTITSAGVRQGLNTCSCGPTPSPILNPSYESSGAEAGANWTFTKSEPNIIVELASDYNGLLAAEGSWFLVAAIPENVSTDESVQVSQVINLCNGEGQYTFSVNATLISVESSCYVLAWAYQGTGPYPPGPGVEFRAQGR
jgi:hypothetical protein